MGVRTKEARTEKERIRANRAADGQPEPLSRGGGDAVLPLTGGPQSGRLQPAVPPPGAALVTPLLLTGNRLFVSRRDPSDARDSRRANIDTLVVLTLRLSSY
eukprot:1009753-Prorocentrum_minimum.AAC.1